MLKQIVKEIKKANKIALFHHVHPDGDSISSSYGLLLAIKSKYPNKEVVFVADKKEIASLFPNWNIDLKHIVDSIDSSYISIVGDAAIEKRIAHFEEYTKGCKKIVFDHHKLPTKPDFECDLYWREDDFPASAMQAIMIAQKLKANFDEDVAFGLMIGLVTDSGQFTYSANDSRIISLYADMIKYISKPKMVKFFNDSKSRTKENIELTQEILKSIKYSKLVSYVVFDKKFVKKYGREEIKAKLNAIGNIEGYPMWAMILEKENQEEAMYDVSLRSNDRSIMEIAQKYNGGGHEKASGCKLKSKKEIKQIIEELDGLKKL